MYPLKIVHYDDTVSHHLRAGEALETAQLRYVGAPCQGEELEVDCGFATGVFAGAGFLLIKRGVLERMAAAYPETRYTASHNQASPSASPNQYALFDCMIEPETGHYLSEDYTFCHRWRALGGKVWLDTQSRLMHTGPREYIGDASARYAMA
jgi:hypothetical protein